MVISMISNLVTVTLALALSVMANVNMDRDVVFFTEPGCAGSFLSYTVNMTQFGCQADCLILDEKYFSVYTIDKQHEISFYFYQDLTCNGTFITMVLQTANYNNTNACTNFTNPVTLLPSAVGLGSAKGYKGVCPVS
jgi:hypothetical protein